MADYTATTRSNYFRVKDPAAFEAWCRKRFLTFWTQDIDNLGKCYAITADTGDCAGWPNYDAGTDDNFEICIELAGHLVPTDVAILFEVGNEKLRYLTGYATAIAPNGETVSVSINDIYQKAAEAFLGFTVTEGSY